MSRLRVFFIVLQAWVLCACSGPTLQAHVASQVPNSDAKWPWRHASSEEMFPGVTRWVNDETNDGSTIELYKFDFKKNPKLRLSMLDQDQDDATPFDNKTDYFDQNAAVVTRKLIDKHQGTPIVVWNGLFHSYDRSFGTPKEGFATHIGPNVIDGRARYNYGSIRWAFGVKQAKNGPQFVLQYRPTIEKMERAMTFGAIGAQCLVFNGRPLKLQSPPNAGDPPLKTPVATSVDEAGHIPTVDFIQTSRTSMAWSKDDRNLYLLFVSEPDNEVASKRALRTGDNSNNGGWTVADLQRFWMSFKADYAINSDGGIVAQLVRRKIDGNYEFIPPRWTFAKTKIELSTDINKIPKGGGTLMDFVVSEKKS